ncbi:MAG: acylneuraminate cytidylyltransferase family protein [Eubacteriales bacterium]|nr:acylneuraminate cytidylyltransferase family protein [Eubacteriales bacterium]
MKTVAIVPMKLNNRRLPQKNTKRFTNGNPLCYYILSTLLKVEGINEVYVYCSNSDIQEFIPAGVKYLRRSENLDQDTTKMNEVLQCFATDVPADIYVMTHTTAPFISKNSIERGLNAVKSGAYDSSFAARKMQDFLWKDGMPFNYELNEIPRTQDLPALYVETSGFYIYKNEVITKLNRRIGSNPFIVEIGEIESIDIDEAEDFMIADAIFNHIFVQYGGGVIRKYSFIMRKNSFPVCSIGGAA